MKPVPTYLIRSDRLCLPNHTLRTTSMHAISPNLTQDFQYLRLPLSPGQPVGTGLIVPRAIARDPKTTIIFPRKIAWTELPPPARLQNFRYNSLSFQLPTLTPSRGFSREKKETPFACAQSSFLASPFLVPVSVSASARIFPSEQFQISTSKPPPPPPSSGFSSLSLSVSLRQRFSGGLSASVFLLFLRRERTPPFVQIVVILQLAGCLRRCLLANKG